MNSKFVICVVGLSALLTVGCSGQDTLPSASASNCSGRGMELALQEFNERGTEAQRNAFVAACEALAN